MQDEPPKKFRGAGFGLKPSAEDKKFIIGKTWVDRTEVTSPKSITDSKSATCDSPKENTARFTSLRQQPINNKFSATAEITDH